MQFTFCCRVLFRAGVSLVLFSTIGFAVAVAAADTAGDTTSPPQSAPDNGEKSSGLEEVVVTARLAGQISTVTSVGLLGDRSIFDTPFSASSYTDALIQDQQIRSLNDVLDNNPSVRSDGNTFGDTQNYTIRGFEVNHDSLLFDGISGLIDGRQAPIEGIGRVDVFLGPNALLNNVASNSAATGGIINLVPKQAEDTPLTRIIGSYVSNDDLELQADIGRRFGPDGDFGIRVNLSGRNGSPPIDNQYESAGTASVRLDYRSEVLKASLDVVHDDQTLKDYSARFYSAEGFQIPAAPKATNNIYDDTSRYNEINTLELAKIQWKFLDQWLLSVAFGHRSYYDRYLGLYAYPGLIDAAGDVTLADIPDVEEYNTNTADVSLRGDITTAPIQHEITLSADGIWERQNQYANFGNSYTNNIYNPKKFAFTGLPAGPVTPNYEIYRHSVALADVATLLGGRLTLIGGVREQTINDSDLNPDGTTASNDNAHALSPAGSVLYKILPRLTVYANYIQQLASGGTAPIGTVNVGQVLAPFRSEQEELGVKYDAVKYGVTLAFFHIDQPNALTDVVTNVYEERGKDSNQGAEINAFGDLPIGVRVVGGVAFYRVVQLGTEDPTTEGKLTVGIPRQAANLGFEYDLPQLRSLTLTARVIYTSGEKVSYDNTQDIPAWTRLDVGARFAADVGGHSTKFRFGIYNALNKNYWASAADGGELSVGSPRTFRASVATDF